MKLNALVLSLGVAAQLFNLAAAAAACPSVLIKTRNSFSVGKNVTLAIKIVKGKTTAPIRDGVLTVRPRKYSSSCSPPMFCSVHMPTRLPGWLAGFGPRMISVIHPRPFFPSLG